MLGQDNMERKLDKVQLLCNSSNEKKKKTFMRVKYWYLVCVAMSADVTFRHLHSLTINPIMTAALCTACALLAAAPHARRYT
jgi:hypothetical protein